VTCNVAPSPGGTPNQQLAAVAAREKQQAKITVGLLQKQVVDLLRVRVVVGRVNLKPVRNGRNSAPIFVQIKQ
jgi:hypothetical protein